MVYRTRYPSIGCLAGWPKLNLKEKNLPHICRLEIVYHCVGNSDNSLLIEPRVFFKLTRLISQSIPGLNGVYSFLILSDNLRSKKLPFMTTKCYKYLY